MTRRPPDTGPSRGRRGRRSLTPLRVLLLDLLSPQPVASARMEALSADDWLRLAAIARDYRCGPMLHHRRAGEPAIPADLREDWRAAWRDSAMQAMVLKAELRAVTMLLEGAGLAPIALKGAWLAWHGYDDPALRPMSDLDLLLTPETVIAGYELLLANGYGVTAPPEMPLATLLRFDKHLPELVSPRGPIIELHHRLWEPDGRLDHASPHHDEAAVRARAVTIDGVRYPAPEDMLAHLLIHAAYGHRLDCGPVILADVAAFLTRYPVDWPSFWRRTRRENWRAGARLLLHVAAQHGGFDVVLTQDAGSPPLPAILASFPDLILQDRATRQNAGLLASGLAGGGSAVWRRLRGIRAGADGAQAGRDMASEGGFIGWATSRLRRIGGQLTHPELLRQSRDLARFSRWLDEQPSA